MSNNTGTVIITLPVSHAVTANITENLETRWLQMILKAMRHLNLANEHYNVIVLIVMLCLLVMVAIRLIIKYRQRFLCAKKNETQHDTA